MAKKKPMTKAELHRLLEDCYKDDARMALLLGKNPRSAVKNPDVKLTKTQVNWIKKYKEALRLKDKIHDVATEYGAGQASVQDVVNDLNEIVRDLTIPPGP